MDWESEAACFRDVAAALASFYAVQPPLDAEGGGEGGGGGGGEEAPGASGADAADAGAGEVGGGGGAAAAPAGSRDWTLRHVLSPALRAFLRPPRRRAADGTFVQLTSLERLYRTFERC